MHVQPSRVTAMQENYDSLGLSAEDINLIRQYNLTHVLDKIQDQQKLLEEHEQQLEGAKLRQSAQAQQFDQMFKGQELIIKELASQANTLKVLVEADATGVATAQAAVVAESQAEQD